MRVILWFVFFVWMFLLVFGTLENIELEKQELILSIEVLELQLEVLK